MDKIELPEFWWTNMAGPQTAIDEVTSLLMKGRSPLLQLPDAVPWLDNMRAIVELDFKQDTNLSDVVFDYIDLSLEMCASPGEFLHHRYAPGDHGYRAGSRGTLQQYLIHRGFLRNRVVWLMNIPSDQIKEWISFVKGYETGGIADGLFVVEIGSTREESGKFAHTIDFSDYIHNHDLQIFCSFLMGAKRQYSDQWQEYISALVAKVCGIDAELAALIIRTSDLSTKTIRQVLENLCERQYLDSPREQQLRTHMQRLLQTEGFQALERRVWSTQIQILFPIIEMERWAFIEDFYELIQSMLDSRYISSFGTQITQACDVELGTLCWMLAQKDTENQYELYIPDDSTRNWIHFLHDCRNVLAHTTECSTDDLNKLFAATDRRQYLN